MVHSLLLYTNYIKPAAIHVTSIYYSGKMMYGFTHTMFLVVVGVGGGGGDKGDIDWTACIISGGRL